MDSSLRYFGCVVGFGFGVLWMTEGLGAAILCLLLAGLGYGAILFLSIRGPIRTRSGCSCPSRTPSTTDLPSQADELSLDLGHVYEPSDDAASPLTAEADYGWPVEEPELAHTNGR